MITLRKRLSLPKISLPAWKWPRLSGRTEFPPLRIGDLEVPVPVIQGGMAVGISLSGLAAAVAREGGIGVIAATAVGMGEPGYFRNGREANARALTREIRRFRESVQGVLGINIMVAADDFDNLLKVCIRERVDIVFLGAGLPIRNIPVAELREAGVKVAPIVSSPRAATLIFQYWRKAYRDIPDAVVVEGPLAGGHLGFPPGELDRDENRLENLIPRVVAAVEPFRRTDAPIPVIAAGGVFTGKDIWRFLNLGAAGVQMGTRFVATRECDAHDRFKEAFVAARQEDIRIIRSPVGLAGRALKGEFFDHLENSKAGPARCTWKCLRSCGAEKARYCISLALDAARRGDLKHGFAFAGANAWRVDRIMRVNQLIRALAGEYAAAAEESFVRLRREYEKAMARIADLRREYIRVRDAAAAALSRRTGLLAARKKMLREESALLLERLSAIRREYLHTVRRLRARVNHSPFIAASDSGHRVASHG